MHLILGLPGESLSHMCASVDAIGHLPIATVKFHQLQVVKGTRLARMALQGIIQPPAWTARQYAHVCAQLVNRLAPHIAIERFVSESPWHMILSPRWGIEQGVRAHALRYLPEDMLSVVVEFENRFKA